MLVKELRELLESADGDLPVWFNGEEGRTWLPIMAMECWQGNTGIIRCVLTDVVATDETTETPT